MMKKTKYEVKLSTLFLSYHHNLKHTEFNFVLTKRALLTTHVTGNKRLLKGLVSLDEIIELKTK